MTDSFFDKPLNLIARVTLLAGALDIGSAIIFAILHGRHPLVVLIGIASAVWPGARAAGFVGALAGLLLHFVIMFTMVAAYMAAARRAAWMIRHPVLSGGAYGLGLWCVMYLIVLPWRWPSLFPNFAVSGVTEQLFSHVVLVGLPIAWLIRPRSPA